MIEFTDPPKGFHLYNARLHLEAAEASPWVYTQAGPRNEVGEYRATLATAHALLAIAESLALVTDRGRGQKDLDEAIQALFTDEPTPEDPDDAP